MKQSELAQVIYKNVTEGYYLDATGRLSARVRAEKAAAEIAFILRQQDQPKRARTVVVKERPA